MAFQMAVILSYCDLLYLWAGLSVGCPVRRWERVAGAGVSVRSAAI